MSDKIENDNQELNNETPDTKELVRSLLVKLSKMTYIKPSEVPNIDLYMDQVTTFMDSHLSEGKRKDEDKILTKTMINNYAKNDLLPPPVKKKYSKDHVYILMFIYYLKNLMSISDIQALLGPLTDKFFDGQGEVNLDTIYKEIFKMEKRQLGDITRSINNQFNISSNAFSDIKDDNDREYLQLFSFVCLMGFDIFMKKYMIESLIDDYVKKQPENTNPEKNKKKK